MKSVLIVDDSSYYRERAADLVEKEGYTYYFAEDGDEAVELYEKINPEFVIMDICMPVMDGLEATKLICRENKNAKVLICSSVGHIPVYKKTAFKNGAVGILPKEFSESDLKLAIEELKFL